MTDVQTAPTTPANSQTCNEPAELKVDVYTIDESFHRHFAAHYWAWREVFEHDPHAKISQHPDFVLTELSFAREPQHHPPVLITCQEHSKTISAAVLLPRSIGGEKKFGPAWHLKGYRLAGNRLLGCSDERIQNRLLEEISQQLASTNADFLLIEDVQTDDPLLNLINKGSHDLQLFKPVPFQSRHMIELPATLDEYWAKFNSATRGKIKRKTRLLSHCRVERITRPFQVADFLANAQQISKQTWQNDLLGLRIQNDEFELQLFTFLATQDALRAYLVWDENTPISFCIGTQYNGVFHYEEVGYNRDYAKKSPGQYLVIRMLEDMYEHERPVLCDFGGGHADYKRMFGTRVSESGNVWLLRPGLRSKMIMTYFNGRLAVTQSIRQTLDKLGLLNRLRKLTRKGLKSKQQP
ncbi:MAG: GNAT family N-acetyltransferase [Rhodopirellula sp.]|nr:GNAT family N-acetyltransferase [Rhodopirellula sp.]